jgi:hypothetical protein
VPKNARAYLRVRDVVYEDSDLYEFLRDLNSINTDRKAIAPRAITIIMKKKHNSKRQPGLFRILAPGTLVTALALSLCGGASAKDAPPEHGSSDVVDLVTPKVPLSPGTLVQCHKNFRADLKSCADEYGPGGMLPNEILLEACADGALAILDACIDDL